MAIIAAWLSAMQSDGDSDDADIADLPGHDVTTDSDEEEDDA